MKAKRSILLVALFLLALSVGGRWDDEGMWLLDSIHKLPLSAMKPYGLALSPDQIYNPNGPSLKDAIVLLGGGTSSFISANGLMITNHHVAYGGIQSLSSVKDDYLKNGFYARTQEDELSTNYTAQIVKEIRDVTPEVLAAVSDTMNAAQRDAAIKAKIADMEKTAKGTSDLTCRITEMYSGVKYYLFTFETLNDIRLVYAPPTSIGNYGGEVDNWMWPRHTGDFSLMRAYVAPDGKPAKYAKNNVPYHPKMFLPISTQGVHDSSFAMIMGFPGRTYRYREAAGVEVLRDDQMPEAIDLYKTRMAIIESWGKNDREIEIKYANKLRGMANTYKNYLGVLEGMRKARVVELRKEQEATFTSYIAADATLKAKYGSVLADLAKADAGQKAITRKNLVSMNLSMGADIFGLAQRFRRYASAPQPTAQDSAAILEFAAGMFKNYDVNVEKATLEALLLKAAELPPAQQFSALSDLLGTEPGTRRAKAIHGFVEDLYHDTDLGNMEGCVKLLAKGPEKILKDDYVKFVGSLEQEQTALMQENGRLNATLTSLRAKYLEALLASKTGTEMYPDANRTIRFTYGQVKGFVARDAVTYSSVTTLTGVMEKETGEDPFIVPAKLKELWQKKDFGRYADPVLKDVPVAFTADLDITGGNSGSPVINGKGELIGCAFDGNWEAVVGDYYFQESLNRTIAVDARYVLFVLDKFSNAQSILNELVIH